jgi:YggT family protein
MNPGQAGLGTQLVWLVHAVFWVLQLLVLARVIISWVPVNRYHPLVRVIHDLTEPMLRPLRAVLRTGAGGIDFSPLILLLVLWIAERIVISLLVGAL